LNDNRLGRDHVLQRATLLTWEYAELIFFARSARHKDGAAARAAEGLWVVVVTTSA